MMDIEHLFRLMVSKEASDLHLKVPSPPILRINGELILQKDSPHLSGQQIDEIFASITTPH